MVRLLSVASYRGFEKEIPNQARKILFHMDPDKAVPMMIDVLDIPDVSSLVLLKSLFMRYAFHAVPALTAERKERTPLLELRRCYYLGVLKDTRALPFCLDRIEDPSWKVRSAAVRAIGDILDRQRLENLVPMKKAFEAASKQKNPEAIRDYLDGDKKRCGMVLSVVVRALPLSPELYNRFSRQCKGGKKEAGKEAFTAFVYEHLLQILPVMDVWTADIQVSRETARRLMPLLNDADPEVRRAAAYSLGQLRYRPAVSPLLDLLHDPELWVRDGAVLSLALFKDDAVGPLGERMKQEGPRFRILALDVLARIKTDRAKALIDEYIDNPDENVGRAAAQALAEAEQVT
jgi:hypothetical protein